MRAHSAAMPVRRAAWLALATLVVGAPAPAVLLSPDVSADLEGIATDDEDVVIDDVLGVLTPLDLGALPSETDVDAVYELENGDRLFSLDVPASLPGSLTVMPEDVVRYDGAAYTLEFDGSAAGIADGVSVDAVSQDGGGDLLLSFDVSLDLGGFTADDEDLVGFDGLAFSLFFDGSAAGVPEALDLDGASYEPSRDQLLASFDASGTVAGVEFDDEDVVAHALGAGTWTHHYDGSALHPGLERADVDAVAVPEPGQTLMLGAGLGLLTALRSRRGARER